MVVKVAKIGVSQFPYPLLSIRQETQGQQSLRVVVEWRNWDVSGGKRANYRGWWHGICMPCMFIEMSKFLPLCTLHVMHTEPWSMPEKAGSMLGNVA